MRHLITGAAGFVGSHLAERLIAEGHEIIAFDNFFTGHRRNVEHLMASHRFELVRGDVCDPFHFEVDRIWSLACPASPVHYQKNAARTIETGILGTLNALKLAQKVGARLLLTSTSEIYGDPLEHPQSENYRGNVNHVGPRACYDTAKCASEALCSTWARQYGVEVRIARIFNTFGPRMAVDDGRVVSNFIVQALRGEPLTIYGDGKQTRSFMFIDDLVDGLMRLMESRPPGRALTVGHKVLPLRDEDEPWFPRNLGNPGEFTMVELALLVQDIVGSSTRIEHRPLPADDPTRRKPDITRARMLLGWEPKVQLAEGLRRTVDYFRAHLGLVGPSA